jgi:hypothetical protein
MRVNFQKKEMIMKIVYFGPSQGGKTTNLRYVHNTLSPEVKGRFMSINTQEDRTLFFDFFDVTTSAKIRGGRIKVRFELYTVPGQVKYEETRRLVMKGADGVVFVSDSQEDKMAENIYSRADMDEILMHYRQDPKKFPTVIQYNKRDLPNISPVEKLRKALNPRNNPDFTSVAITGENIMETLNKISSEVIRVNRERFA